MIAIQPISAFKDNYIWLLSNRTENALIVDPGEAEPVKKAFKNSDKQLSAVFITHHHHDHTGGLEDLLAWRPDLAVYGSYQSKNQFITHPVREGDVISLLDTTFHALEIPGHTLDHTAFYNDDVLFSGDMLFSAGCGKVFEGTYEQMFSSLEKLSALPDSTQLFCGHEYTLNNLLFAKTVEPENTFIQEKLEKIKSLREKNLPTLPSTLREEKLMNPFLRCREISVIQAVETEYGKKFNSPLEVFTALREWKNRF